MLTRHSQTQLEEATAAHLATTELHKRQVQELAAAVNIERSSLLKELNRARADAFRMSAMLEGGVTPPRQSITDDLYMELQGARDQLVARARDLEGVQVVIRGSSQFALLHASRESLRERAASLVPLAHMRMRHAGSAACQRSCRRRAAFASAATRGATYAAGHSNPKLVASRGLRADASSRRAGACRGWSQLERRLPSDSAFA